MAAVTSMLLAGGVAASAAGSYMSYSGAEDAAAAQAGITEQEMDAERQRMKQMELDARRKQLEVIRTQQQMQSLSLTTATAQGAQGGSGLPGAFGQISGQTNTNLLGINQNLTIGRNMFEIQEQMAAYKMQMADAQTTQAMGQGLSSLGGSLMSASSAFGNLTKTYMPGMGVSAPSAPYNPMGYGQQMSWMGRGPTY